jgi:hypothetical protein
MWSFYFNIGMMHFFFYDLIFFLPAWNDQFMAFILLTLFCGFQYWMIFRYFKYLWFNNDLRYRLLIVYKNYFILHLMFLFIMSVYFYIFMYQIRYDTIFHLDHLFDNQFENFSRFDWLNPYVERMVQTKYVLWIFFISNRMNYYYHHKRYTKIWWIERFFLPLFFLLFFFSYPFISEFFISWFQ